MKSKIKMKSKAKISYGGEILLQLKYKDHNVRRQQFDLGCVNENEY